MTITRLIVGGFKSLKESVEIPLAPITLVFTSLDKPYAAACVPDDPGAGIRDHAKWLGLVSAESDEIKVTQDARSKDDFVNDALSRSLFSARRYRINAEVSVRGETMVLPCDATWSADAEVSMQSTLWRSGLPIDAATVGSLPSRIGPSGSTFI